MSWFELIPWTFSLGGRPCTINLLTSLEETQEWLHAESQSAKIFSDLSGDRSSTSVTCNKPLTSVTEGRFELLTDCPLVVVVPMQSGVLVSA